MWGVHSSACLPLKAIKLLCQRMTVNETHYLHQEKRLFDQTFLANMPFLDQPIVRRTIKQGFLCSKLWVSFKKFNVI